MGGVGRTAGLAARRRARRALDARSQATPVVLVVFTVGAVLLARSVPAGGAMSTVLDDSSIALVVASALGLMGAPAGVRRSRRRRSDMDEVDRMTGEEFEARVGVLFADLGERVVHTGGSGDFGADLVIERHGIRSVVQVKRYGGAVGIEAVQQVIGARAYYDADAAIVVTNSSLTPAALALAQADGVEAIERAALVSLLAGHPVERGRCGSWALCLQIADGIVLVGYVAVVVSRVVCWVARVGLRTVHRSAGGS